MKIFRIGLLSLVGFVAAFLIFSYGVLKGRDGLEFSLENTQGELAFHHFNNYSRLIEDIGNGCAESAIEKLEFYIYVQKMLMAEIIQDSDFKNLKVYIQLRDSHLLDNLMSLEVDWDRSLILHGCPKN